jgi:hypothetical protein
MTDERQHTQRVADRMRLFPNCGNVLHPPDTPLPPIRRPALENVVPRNGARSYPVKVRLGLTTFDLDLPDAESGRLPSCFAAEPKAPE